MLRNGESERAETDSHLDRAFECDECGRRWYYDRHRCPDCGDGDYRSIEIGQGELVATTVARVTPPDVRDENPLGVARFDGFQLAAQLSTDTESRPDVGDVVELRGTFTLRHDSDGRVVGPRLVSSSEP